jgi:predicted alpha-1,2-mannosidase
MPASRVTTEGPERRDIAVSNPMEYIMTSFPTRRAFLQRASLLPLAAALPVSSAEAYAPSWPDETPGAAPDVAEATTSLVSLVNPMQGTNSSIEFSRGNTLPIVARPFGMAHWTLQSHDRAGWFFEPSVNRLQGIRLTHQLSPWLGDYGYAAFLPVTGEVSADPGGRSSSYRPREMEISPASLKLFLLRYRCSLELTPTERCCAMRFVYDDEGDRGLLIDLPGETAEATCDAVAGIVRLLTHENRGGVAKNFATFLHVHLDRPIASFVVKELKGSRVVNITFQAQAKEAVEVRVGTSFISPEQAELNLKQEVGSRSFAVLTREAESTWEQALSRVRLEGRTRNDHRTFYSCPYRTLLFPRIWHEQNAAGEIVHRSPYTGRLEPGLLYADHEFWDDYHAWYPMMLLLYPERLRDILQSWVLAYKEGGWIPQFPCPGYRGAMTGSPSDIIFGDAAAKGLGGFDLKTAYEGLRKQSMQPVKGFGFGRTQLEPYLRLGYVPCDKDESAVAETLDYAFGDFCVSQVANALGKADDAAHFLERSRSWQNIFDPKMKFFRGKRSNGQWLEPFDPFTWGGTYVEGGPWQYRFNVPNDPDSLVKAFDGRNAFARELEAMFTLPPRFHVGSYGSEIHEMSEMAAINFGQYAHNNQPVHNVLYLFTLIGMRDRTQHYAHRVLKELYSPDDFAGDEDTGSMSAWYILSSLGLFAACPGDSRWTLGAPFFPAAIVSWANGRQLRIETHTTEEDAFLRHVTLNGKPTDGMRVEHAALLPEAGNGHLVFTT